MSEFIKDPNAVLDYQWNWSEWLVPADSIVAATVTTNSDDLSVNTVNVVGSIVTAWLSGGVAGVNYRVTCRVESADGRIDDRSISLRVRER